MHGCKSSKHRSQASTPPQCVQALFQQPALFPKRVEQRQGEAYDPLSPSAEHLQLERARSNKLLCICVTKRTAQSKTGAEWFRAHPSRSGCPAAAVVDKMQRPAPRRLCARCARSGGPDAVCLYACIACVWTAAHCSPRSSPRLGLLHNARRMHGRLPQSPMPLAAITLSARSANITSTRYQANICSLA